MRVGPKKRKGIQQQCQENGRETTKHHLPPRRYDHSSFSSFFRPSACAEVSKKINGRGSRRERRKMSVWGGSLVEFTCLAIFQKHETPPCSSGSARGRQFVRTDENAGKVGRDPEDEKCLWREKDAENGGRVEE